MRALLLRGVGLAAFTFSGAAAQTPMQVMSDTPGYCAQLEAQLAGAMAAMTVTAEIKALAEAGHRMCHEGEIRAGITRLRLALIGLRNGHGNLPPAAGSPPEP